MNNPENGLYPVVMMIIILFDTEETMYISISKMKHTVINLPCPLQCGEFFDWLMKNSLVFHGIGIEKIICTVHTLGDN
jgi:hypothetical protein